MGSLITLEKIREMKDFLREHPVDHQYDKDWNTFGATIPGNQMIAVVYEDVLKELGELPKDLTTPPTRRSGICLPEIPSDSKQIASKLK